jgi:hypothetical protein
MNNLKIEENYVFEQFFKFLKSRIATTKNSIHFPTLLKLVNRRNPMKMTEKLLTEESSEKEKSLGSKVDPQNDGFFCCKNWFLFD